MRKTIQPVAWSAKSKCPGWL